MESSATEQSRLAEIQDWTKGWQAGQTPFHKDEVHPIFLEYHKQLLGDGPKTVLIPLSGKTLDMKWLYDQGHTVIGVEAVELAVKSFFEENNLKYVVEDRKGEDFKAYMTEDGRVTLLVGDFFKLTSKYCKSPIDAIWDRGSLSAINPRDREEYAKTVNGVLVNGGKILIEVFDYDPKEYGGPPQRVTKEDLEAMYGSFYDTQHLQTIDAYKLVAALKWSPVAMYNKFFMVTKK